MEAGADLGVLDKDGHAHALAGLLERLRRIAGQDGTGGVGDSRVAATSDPGRRTAPGPAGQTPRTNSDTDRRIGVAELFRTLGPASFTAVLMVPALIVVSPLSGIPLLPTVCGLTIALIALQMSFGRDHLWLPGWLLARSMARKRFLAALAWIERPAGWIDWATGQRLAWLTGPPFRSLLLAACALAGAAMPFLELLPFTSSILAGAVVLIALGLLVGDGLAALLGLGLIGGGVGLILWLVG